MTNLWALTVREWKAFWYSPIAYVVGAFFILLQGWVFWLLVAVLNDPRVDPTWNMAQFFFGGTLFYWVSVTMLAPLLTMRTFSEEKRTGSIELLLSAPVTDGQVVVAKFLGAWLSYCALWGATLAFFFIFQFYSRLDWGAVITGYVGTWLLGGVLIAMGVLASSFTRNQIIAAVVAFVLVLMLFSFGLLEILVNDPDSRRIVQYLSLLEHFRSFSKGVLDTRPIVFYVSLAAGALFLTTRTISSPRWRG